DPTNTAPAAVTDLATVNEDDTTTIAVLTNDSDPDGDPVIITNLGTAGNGSVAIDDNGTPGDQTDDRIVFTPDADFHGADSFTYTIADGRGGSDSATVSITVEPVNDAPVASDATLQVSDAAQTNDIVGQVPASDVDGDTLSYTIIAGNDDGVFDIDGSGNVFVADASGLDAATTPSYALSVEVSDGEFTDTATINVTVSAPAAVFSDDFNGTSLDEEWSFLGVDGSATLVSNADDSWLEINSPSGVFVDAFNELTTPRVLQPVEDGDFQIAARFLNEPQTSNQEHGLLIVQDDQTWIRFDVAFTSSGLKLIVGTIDGNTRSLPVFNGIDSGVASHLRVTREDDVFTFEYSADGDSWTTAIALTSDIVPTAVGPFGGSTTTNGTSPPGFVSQVDWFLSSADPIVAEDNVTPVAADDAIATDVDTPLVIDVAADLLANDSDGDGDPLVISGFVTPTSGGGAVTDNGDGTLTYTPGTGFFGEDSFTYTVSDGQGGEDVATVTVTVADPTNTVPVAADDTVIVNEDDTATIAVLTNDSDPDGDPVIISSIGAPGNGLAAIDDNGTPGDQTDDRIVYTPDADFHGADSFTYILVDGRGGSATATVTVTAIPAPDAPDAVNDTVTTQPGAPVVIPVLANDTDADGDVPQVIGVTQGIEGAVVINADGTVTYTPGAGFSGTDYFDYTIGDGNGGTDTATVAVSFQDPDNTPPFLTTGETRFDQIVVDTTMPLTHYVAPADFDGDGDIDLASTSEELDSVAWFRNDGNLGFEKVDIDTNLDSAYPLSLDDLDGDGDVDVLVGGYRADLFVWYENDGTANFTKHIVGAKNGPHSIVAFDMDGDGDKDLVTSSQDAKTVAWYENDGAQSFTERVVDSNFSAAKTAFPFDIDGDGDPDILATSNGGDKVAWYENDGSQNFAIHIIDTNAAGAYFALSADIDGDGDQDILGASQNDNHIALYVNDGAENFTKQIVDSSALGARAVSVADIDGDSDLDLLSASVDDDSIAWYENNGGTSFTEHSVASVDGAYGVAASDVDQDGDIDVLSAGRNDGTISIHRPIRQHTASIDSGETLNIDNALVMAVDNEDPPSALIYTVLTLPDAGELCVNGIALQAQGTFTQQDIDDGVVAYVNTDSNALSDRFEFNLSDSSSGGNSVSGALTVTIRGDLPPPIYELPGTLSVDGTSTSVVEVSPQANLTVAEGSISFGFTTNDAGPQQGLASRDATGFGTGGHFSAHIDNDDLIVRFQNASSDTTVTYENLIADQEYHVVATFGASGVQLYVNGVLEAENRNFSMDWLTNNEFMQIGALGWGSNAGQSGFVSPLNGTISDFRVFDGVLTAEHVAALGGSGSGSSNSAPEPIDDAATVNEDASVTIAVLANDSDPDGDPVMISSIGVPGNGLAAIDDNGTPANPTDDQIVYTPNPDFFGADSFQVTIGDGNGGFDTSQVDVTVEPVEDDPVANDDTAAVQENMSVDVNVVANDTDADGDALTVINLADPDTGSVVDNGDGTVTYRPNLGFVGIDGFEYTLSDGGGPTSTAEVTVEVTEEPVFPAPAFEQAGISNYSGSSGDVDNFAHSQTLEIVEGTIAFSFIDDNPAARQGLVVKDASGFVGGGNHFAAYIDKGDLKVRIQDGSDSLVFTFDDLVAGEEYEVAATFGPDGSRLYVDGQLVGEDTDFVMNWQTNQEYLQVGGLGWASATGAGDFTAPFSGQMADLQIFDQALSVADIQTLANASSFDLI
ncbi:MAG: tandem-95 repeat protein, partial [bacterium]|nr:tandem-95 repeat protein [bacterium]